MSAESKVLRALRKRNRVTRKTAIERGWAENLTATISRLRKMGHDIIPIKTTSPEGETYTRYRLMA
tara:strand:+ start:998 stop:1195 length:198 start_codon:yes stop_codon:yes gene_type:complete